MKQKHFILILTGTMIVLSAAAAFAYPIDGFEQTGIRRLERLQRIVTGEIPGRKPLAGAQKPLSDIKLNLLNDNGRMPTGLPEPEPELQKKIKRIFPGRHKSYSLALLDITPGRPVRYAARQENHSFSPGSVGKLAIAVGLFAELKARFPDDPEKRRNLLKTRRVTADRFIRSDHHKVPLFNPETNRYKSRAVREGDVFTLYEWADHMLSASANSAASTVWKEVVLMRGFGAAYPPSPEEEKAFFNSTPKKELKNMAVSTVHDPLRAVGISDKEWRLGNFFTSAGKRIVPGQGGSRGTPLGLLKFLVAMEQGQLVDEWSSLEIKRLMYMTARRIRYASAPRLKKAAVYFKSGSLYKCRSEKGGKCGKYMGNVFNYMNSVAIVEHPDGTTYLVSLMSNILRVNSAVEHQTLATYIDRAVRGE